jgi:hypothetical protein
MPDDDIEEERRALFAGSGLAWIALGADLPDPATASWLADYEALVRRTIDETLAHARSPEDG